MLAVIGFLIILPPLVIFHEFGHYIFARIFGVKAEVFSIGFGPRLFSRQLGETDFRVSAIPLGGYVKLLGEDREAPLPPELAKRALHRQAPWKRFFIFFGGPLFNFILAIFVFMAMMAIGEPMAGNVVGRVIPGTAAAKAGFQSGDTIVSVDGTPVRRFVDVLNEVNDNPGKTVNFEVRHPGSTEPVKLAATPVAEDGYTVYGEAARIGEIDGLSEYSRSTTAGVSDPSSPAAKAGIQSGAEIVQVSGKPVTTWEELERAYDQAAPGSMLVFTIKPEDGAKQARAANWLEEPKVGLFEVSLEKPKQGRKAMAEAWGLHSAELFVDKPIPKSPAEAAGVLHGDRLIGVGSQDVVSFLQLRDAIQKSGEATGKVTLRWEHEGHLVTHEIVPNASTTKDAELKSSTQYTVGVAPFPAFTQASTIIERVWNPFVLLYKGTTRMVTFTWRNFVSIGKMITGNVSVATLGGPILIGKVAGESLAHGLVSFLGTMAILSIGLGVLNVLPVPVLDGGHLVLLLVESIRRKPLTVRQMEIVQGIGLALILALMGVVFRNDISRWGSF